MSERVFFYGTLMTPFNRPGRQRINQYLSFVDRGSIQGALFDLGIYPAAVPSAYGRVWGEVFEISDGAAVLAALDEIEGYRGGEPKSSLYTGVLAPVALDNGSTVEAWVYFYNAPLGHAQRIESGDYLEHLKVGK